MEMVTRRRAIVVAVVAFGLVVLGVAAAGAPAYAADDRVSLRANRSFAAGGDGGSVVVSVTKRTKGCVGVRTVLGVQLDGLEAGQVRVQAQGVGGWQEVAVSGGGGGVATGAVVPQRQRVCEKQTATVRYRLAFGDDVKSGSGSIVGEAYTAAGALIGSDSTDFRLNGVKPSPTPKTPEPRTSTEAPPVDDRSPVDAAVVPTAGNGDDSGGLSGFDVVLMAGGLGLVGLGGALLFFIIRRFRSDKESDRPYAVPADATAVIPSVRPAPADAPTMIIRRVEE
jgi:hypothetical protein